MTHFLALCLVALLCSKASAVGCGVRLMPGDTCTDWQCSRNQSSYCVRGFDKDAMCTSNDDCYNLDCNRMSYFNETLNKTIVTQTCGDVAEGSKNVGVGLVGAVIGVLCFGSSFVPIKKYKRYAGDGVFAQFCMCFGRFIVGVIMLATRDNVTFYWDAALGGALWCLGNVMSVPIIQCIGIGLGVSIWGTTNMILGWASGHFGWWGIKEEISKVPALEYVGVVLSAAGIVLFIFVRPRQQMQHAGQVPEKTEEQAEQHQEDENQIRQDERAADAEDKYIEAHGHHTEASSLITQPETLNDSATENDRLLVADKGQDMTRSATSLSNLGPSFVSRSGKATLAETLGAKQARFMGIGMALAAGCLYGICMDPAQHMMTRYRDLNTSSKVIKYSPFGLDYVFSNNVGAMTMSSLVLTVYLVLEKFNMTPSARFFDPVQHGKLLLPAMASGAIGSVGSAAWFFANQNLGLVVSFPIIAAGPGVVSSLWGAIVFKEIHGMRNFIILGFAFAAVIMSAVMSSLGKTGV